MNRILQAQENAKLQFQRAMQPSRTSGLLLFFEGVNKAGITATIEDLGNIVVKRNSKTIVNRPAQAFTDIADIQAGSNLFESVVASTFKASVFIPFYIESFKQALNITGASELVVSYEPKSDSDVNFESLSLSIYTEESQLPEAYQPYWLGQDQSVEGSVSDRPYQLNTSNIAKIFVKEIGTTTLTKVGLRQDGRQKFDSQNLDVLKAGTLYENRLEDGDFDMIELETYTKGVKTSVANNDSTILLSTSGNSEVQITVLSVQ